MLTAAVVTVLGPIGLQRFGIILPRPALLRRLALGEASLRISELLASGVPMTEALRAVAPGGPKALAQLLSTAAQRVERGQDLAAALDDRRWFDEEFTRVIAVGEAGGDLPVMLERLGRRLERDARRRLDRLTALAEPAVILLLAVVVGLVVMAAILPLVRIKDIV